MNKLFPLVGLASISVLCSSLEASSAVAVAINKQGGLGCGYAYNPGISEAEAKRRAIEHCLNWGGRNSRIIASSSKRGFGAIIWFLRADKKLDYTAALAAPTWQLAVNQAKQKAKSSGGTAFKVIMGWNDGLRTNQPIIMQKL
jgi:hypothetical protein